MKKRGKIAALNKKQVEGSNSASPQHKYTNIMKRTFIRINSNYEPAFEVESITKGEEQFIETKDGKYRLTEYISDEGFKFYGFGFLTNDTSERPGHGGEWSSNPRSINEIFGTNLCGCSVRAKDTGYNTSLAVKIEDVIIPDCLKRINNNIFSLYLVEKGERKFPKSCGYYSHTTLDEYGRIIEPSKANLKSKLEKYHYYDKAELAKKVKEDIAFIENHNKSLTKTIQTC